MGPVPPTKSGVARHTAALAREMALDNDLRVWSFKRQYPRFLYPGGSERNAGFAAGAIGARAVLDGSNPLTWRATLREIRAWQPDLVVLPVWTFFLAPALGWIARGLRRSGTECVMVVHNAFDHETAAWKARLSLWQLGQADRFVTHNAALADQLAAHFPRRPVGIFPHPVFDDFPAPAGVLPREAGIEFLFFGLVRPYKGLDTLLEAFARAGRQDARLTIVGEFWQGEDETRALIDRLGIANKVEMVARFVTDAEAAEYFARADAVVLPYRSVTGSGVIPTAYHYGRPVIASDLPGLADVVCHGDTGWLVPVDDVAALSDILAGLMRVQAETAGRKARAYGAGLTWKNLAALVLDRPRE